MLQAIYCPIRQAKQPFHLKSVDMNFFSLEELFYFYTQHEILIDDSIMSEEFVYWVKEKLGQEALGEKLHQQIGARCSLTMFLGTLLGQINTMEESEKEEFLTRLSRMENKNELQRRKILADQMAEREKYEAAILEYRRILKSCETGGEDNAWQSSVWHNLGCCYGRLLQVDQALECFRTAYSFVPAKETREAVAYLQQMEEQQPEIKEDDTALNLLERSNKSKREARYQQLRDRMKEYLRSTR